MIEVKPDSEETSHLLERIGAGEREAFEGLFARHRDWLRRLVELRRNARAAHPSSRFCMLPRHLDRRR